MLSTIRSAKQKSLQMCAELRHCQRWVTNRERQRVPQWRTRDGNFFGTTVSCIVLEIKLYGGEIKFSFHCQEEPCYVNLNQQHDVNVGKRFYETFKTDRQRHRDRAVKLRAQSVQSPAACPTGQLSDTLRLKARAIFDGWNFNADTRAAGHVT